MNSKYRILSLSLILTLFSLPSFAQDQVLMYGTLTTVDGESYTGQLRWGKEEALWTDLFNGTKEENENYRYLSRDDRNALKDKQRGSRRSWGGWVSWSSSDYQTTHEFQARFGDISKLEIDRRSEVRLTMRNGETFYVKNGSNDFDTEVHVMDPEMGKTSFRWSRIESVEFKATPKNLTETFGTALYGTVDFYGGSYTGYIQWDHDERLSTDILDGDTRDGDVKVEFGNIASIEKDRGGANVTLQSGREMYLRGSNDVDSGNRGIIVTTDFGRVDITWRDFEKVTFTEAPSNAPGYDAYNGLTELKGTVTTVDGQTLSGKLIYDLDEAYTFEMLQGNDDDIEYIIPMEHIKSISPKNYDYSEVVLKNGDNLVIGDARDVSEANDGVLVFTGSGDPTYVIWEDIETITFD
jgi:hypothetical protein